MEQAKMDSLIEAHIASEKAADPAGAVANYTEGISRNPDAPWFGLAPDGSVLIIRDESTRQIYSLDWEE